MARRILILTAGAAFVLLVGLTAYSLVSGKPLAGGSVQARSATMPAQPYIVYAAPPEAQRGVVNHEVMQARGAESHYDWRTTRRAAQDRPVDALLIDAALFETASAADLAWLRSQYHEGVVIGGLGIVDDEFAQVLGLETFRVPGEGNVPIGPTGYRLTHSLILGHPDDVANSGNWLGRLVRGEDPPESEFIRHPMIRSFGASRGELNKAADLDGLFQRLRYKIEGMYRMRAEYQAMLTNTP